MNIEIIKALKERAKEMLADNYNRKIGDEEIYTIICELENFYTAYEKEKEKNKELTDEYLIQRDLINPEFMKDYISKDKIKAKIEEIELNDKKYKNYLKDGRENFTPEYVWARPVLQSLLEVKE